MCELISLESASSLNAPESCQPTLISLCSKLQNSPSLGVGLIILQGHRCATAACVPFLLCSCFQEDFLKGLAAQSFWVITSVSPFHTYYLAYFFSLALPPPLPYLQACFWFFLTPEPGWSCSVFQWLYLLPALGTNLPWLWLWKWPFPSPVYSTDRSLRLASVAPSESWTDTPLVFRMLTRQAGTPTKQLHHPRVFNSTPAFQIANPPADLYLDSSSTEARVWRWTNKTNAAVVLFMPPRTVELWSLFKHFFYKLSNPGDAVYNTFFFRLF